MRKLYAILLIVFFVVACFSVKPALAVYTYTLHGPYYDNGTVVDGNVNVTLKFFGAATQNFIMHGNGVTANTTIISSSVPAQTMYWNSSSSLNYTSVYDFLDGSSDEVNLYVANPADVVGLYTFTISDIGANMVNPFLQTSMTPDGVNSEIVERRSLNGTAVASFVMTQFTMYTLTFICEAGSYSQSFLADTTLSISMPVLYGAFPASNSSSPTLQATRLNSSAISIVYADSTSSTSWLYLLITHRNGIETINDYTGNTTGSSQTIIWNKALANQNYIIYGNVSLSGTIFSWQITVPKTADANPWDGQLDWLGPTISTYPDALIGWPQGMTSIQVGQLVACGIIMLFLSIGSFRNAGATMIIAWVAGGLMFAMGWYTGGASQAGASGIPLFGFALFLGIITHFQEKKSEGAGLS